LFLSKLLQSQFRTFFIKLIEL